MLWILIVLMFFVFGKTFTFAMKAAWGLTRMLLNFVCFPIVLIGMAVSGLISIAFPLLLIFAIVSFFRMLAK